MKYQVDLSKQIPFWDKLTNNQQDVLTDIAKKIRPCELFCKHCLMTAARTGDSHRATLELESMGVGKDQVLKW